MSYIYSDPEREADKFALPNVEVFEIIDGYRDGIPYVLPHEPGEQAFGLVSGWYWQACFPGCLPDGDPMGPFATRAEAIADAQADCEE